MVIEGWWLQARDEWCLCKELSAVTPSQQRSGKGGVNGDVSYPSGGYSSYILYQLQQKLGVGKWCELMGPDIGRMSN